MAWRDKWNTFANENGNDADGELVDLAGVQKGRDESCATDHGNVLAFLSAQTFRESFDWFFDEFKTLKHFLWRLAREDVVLYTAEHARVEFAFLVKTDGHVIGFSSQQNRIDRFPEFTHAVIAFWPRP